MNFGGAGLPHAIRQPETARRQKKSGVLELFPYRASGPFPAMFYSLSDRVPTDVSIALPILARFRPICSRIRTPSGGIPLLRGPARPDAIFRRGRIEKDLRCGRSFLRVALSLQLCPQLHQKPAEHVLTGVFFVLYLLRRGLGQAARSEFLSRFPHRLGEL